MNFFPAGGMLNRRREGAAPDGHPAARLKAHTPGSEPNNPFWSRSNSNLSTWHSVPGISDFSRQILFVLYSASDISTTTHIGTPPILTRTYFDHALIY